MKTPLRGRWPHRVWCGVAVMLCVAATAGAQEPLTRAKALYDAAAYEEALALLAPVVAPEAQQYRALCLLALGRPQDAVGAVESLVSALPGFEPSAVEVPPRFVALVSEAKRKLLPALARRAFSEGREQFRIGAREEAQRTFDLVLMLASSPMFRDTTEAEGLRMLATGFIDLARATAPARPEPKVVDRVAVEPPPPALPPQVIQPVVIRQQIPAISADVTAQARPSATVRVEIGADGKVTAATIQESAHPLFDRLLVRAAREWEYTPASLNGRAIPSERVVTIQLR